MLLGVVDHGGGGPAPFDGRPKRSVTGRPCDPPEAQRTVPAVRRAVERVSSEEGGYEAPHNAREAHAAVRQVRDHVLGPEGETKGIGAVAFNRRQQCGHGARS